MRILFPDARERPAVRVEIVEPEPEPASSSRPTAFGFEVPWYLMRFDEKGRPIR